MTTLTEATEVFPYVCDSERKHEFRKNPANGVCPFCEVDVHERSMEERIKILQDRHGGPVQIIRKAEPGQVYHIVR